MSFRGNSLLLYVEYMSEAVLDYFNLSKGVGSVLLLSFSTSTEVKDPNTSSKASNTLPQTLRSGF